MRLAAAALVAGLAAALAAVPACGPSPSGSSKRWASHTGDVKFVVGWGAGSAAAQRARKPLAIFFTADW